MRKIFCVLSLALALPALAAQSGTTTRSAELRATPTVDGKLLATLPAGAKVEVIKRVGGWYEVKTGAGAAGWVRMWLLRFTGTATNVATLQSGRSSSTYTTATTGVRGLSEEELKNAKPDPAALQTVENLAVAPADARGFAKQADLKASPKFMQEAP
jgi:uncharacterized protein YgiM (DUF1202 family)